MNLKKTTTSEPTSIPEGMAAVCRGVSKSFGADEARVWALRGVDVDIGLGELFMLVGPSGCGKTTLISIIAGTLNSEEGEVLVLGSRLDQMNGRRKTEFRRRNIGFIFQQYNLLPSLTAEENVSVPLILNGIAHREAKDRAGAWLAKVGLDHRRGALPRELSGGQQQRVAIARALVHEPKLLVCDEPTAALDGETGRKVVELLRETALGAGRGVIIVTHDSRIFDIADATAHMLDGRITAIER